MDNDQDQRPSRLQSLGEIGQELALREVVQTARDNIDEALKALVAAAPTRPLVLHPTAPTAPARPRPTAEAIRQGERLIEDMDALLAELVPEPPSEYPSDIF
jgi:hypothetical protein